MICSPFILKIWIQSQRGYLDTCLESLEGMILSSGLSESSADQDTLFSECDLLVISKDFQSRLYKPQTAKRDDKLVGS